MTKRCPGDANDSTAASSTCPKAIGDGKERAEAAVCQLRSASACRAQVQALHLTADLLSERLATIEERAAYLDRGAAVNDGDMSVSGNIAAEGSCEEWFTEKATEGGDAMSHWQPSDANRFLYTFPFEENASPECAGATFTILGVVHTCDEKGVFYGEQAEELGTLRFDCATGIGALMWRFPANGILRYRIGRHIAGGELSGRVVKTDRILSRQAGGDICVGEEIAFHPASGRISSRSLGAEDVSAHTLTAEESLEAKRLCTGVIQPPPAVGGDQPVEIRSAGEGNAFGCLKAGILEAVTKILAPNALTGILLIDDSDGIIVDKNIGFEVRSDGCIVSNSSGYCILIKDDSISVRKVGASDEIGRPSCLKGMPTVVLRF